MIMTTDAGCSATNDLKATRGESMAIVVVRISMQCSLNDGLHTFPFSNSNRLYSPHHLLSCFRKISLLTSRHPLPCRFL